MLLAAVGYILLFSVGRSGKTPVDMVIFPEDAIATLDGEEVKSGTLYLEPGTYSVRAKREGFSDYSKTLVLEETPQTLPIILSPVTREALEFSKKNEEEFEKAYAKGQKAAAEQGKIFNDRNPIAKHLPYKTFFYSVGYRMDPSDPSGNSIIIEIDASEGYRQSALYRIRQLGYDPTDFTINFRDYENPFPL